MNLSTVKAIITGGSSGIGYETAKLLRSHGAEVLICGRNEKLLKEVVFGLK